MGFIADFHIHSHFSIATSRELVPEKLAYWARRKGITVVGTGDFTHPGWLDELQQKLRPAEHGLYALKHGVEVIPGAPESRSGAEVRFMLTAEISTIYKKQGRVRKVHNLVFAPDFDTVERIQHRLSRIGNIQSDGRPILGLDSHDLLEIVLECSDRCFFVPAHIWTPWFSALGAKSGFDTIEACYGDLSNHISAVETGLSSNPPMNWICSFLDGYSIISNSDAHSPEKLGREANLFDTDLDYDAIVSALRHGGRGFRGTVEFFPQEGKYHFDGHRKCGMRLNPLDSLKNGGLCPSCGKKLTIGVLSRVVQLADRDEVGGRKDRHPFHSLIPLKELIAEISGTGVQSKKVKKAYDEILGRSVSELELLIDCPLDRVGAIGGELLQEGISRMRSGAVHIQEGYDGEYGRIRVFKEGELDAYTDGASLFAMEQPPVKKHGEPSSHGYFNFDMATYRALAAASINDAEACNIDVTVSPTAPFELNDEQKRAVTHPRGPALVLAGPGTGKTRVLSARIVHLLQNGIDGRSILAVTFSNRAAEEMRGRIAGMRLNGVRTQDLHISTFHSFGMHLLQEQASHFGRTGDFVILDQRDRDMVVSTLSGGESDAETLAVEIAEIKRGNRDNDTADDLLGRYEETLIACNAFDFDDLICKPLELFRQSPELLQAYRNRYTYVLVDEYQDINASQYRLVSLLKPGPDAQLFAIGDPDQAIYGFRGADASFIDRFMEDYPRAAVYNLTRSYRCSTSILNASQGVIGRSAHDDTFLKGLQSGVRVKITAASSDKSEAEYVARAIETMMGGLSFFSMDSDVAGGAAQVDIQSLSDFAVLCRVKEQMKPLVQALENHSIPHQLVGTTPFYREEPFSSVIDMLRMSLMPENSPLHQRLVRKGIVQNNESYTHRWEGKGVAEAAQECFSLLHRPVHGQNEALTKRFIDLCDIYGSDLRAFIRAVYLGSGTDTYREGVEQVTVMTLHAAKGLEFPCVFIVGCEDGLLPFTILSTCRSDVDEERRLLYVGMTRAKRYLMLSHARRRYLYGMSLKLGRSRFIDAVEDKLLDLSQQAYRAKAEGKNNQLELF